MTAKGWVVVLAMVGELGVTLIRIRLGGCTVTLELPITDSKAAEIVAVPGLMAEVSPAVLVVAMAGAEEAQVATPLMFWELPSEKEPVASSCLNKPTTIVGLAGLMVMETTVALVTVRLAEALTEPEAAVMVVVPGASPEASPALTVAMLGWEEVHLTCEVISRVVPSLKVPTAENCSVVCLAMEKLEGVTESDTTLAAVTVTLATPTIWPFVADTFIVPIFIPCRSPDALTVATEGTEEVHVTEPVRFWVLPSWNTPTALS